MTRGECRACRQAISDEYYRRAKMGKYGHGNAWIDEGRFQHFYDADREEQEPCPGWHAKEGDAMTEIGVELASEEDYHLAKKRLAALDKKLEKCWEQMRQLNKEYYDTEQAIIEYEAFVVACGEEETHD